MKKLSKILLAYDGSDASRNALEQSVRLIRASEGAELLICVVTQMPEVGVEMISINEAMGLSEDISLQIASEAGKTLESKGVRARTVTRKGVPYKEVIELAEEEGADLIITGRRGMTGLERMLMGSVTSRIIGHTDRDVLVVPRNSELIFDSLLVATDGSKFADNALEKALDFGEEYGSSSLTAVSVVDMNSELVKLRPGEVEDLTRRYEKELEMAVVETEATGIEANKVIEIGPVPASIVKAARDCGANMIFMGTHGRTGMAKLFMGSVTEKVIGMSHVPVYVSKGDARLSG